MILVADDNTELRGLSSKASARFLNDLSQRAAEIGMHHVAFESLGGVDVVRRIEAGYRGDVIVLDEDKVRTLNASGFVESGSIRPLFTSDAVLAVAASAPIPDISSVPRLRDALLESGPIAISTGPSGVAFTGRLRQVGILSALEGRLVTAPPGVSVGSVIARGEATLGIQQRSEMLGVVGINVVGALPAEMAITSVFVGAVLATSTNTGRAREFLQSCQQHDAVASLLDTHGLRRIAS